MCIDRRRKGSDSLYLLDNEGIELKLLLYFFRHLSA